MSSPLTARVSPIFVIGERSIEAQRQAEELKLLLRDILEEQNKLKTAMEIRESSLDDFCKDTGRSIKQLISSSGQNPYNSYTKRNFAKKAEELVIKKMHFTSLLNESEKKS